MSAPSSSTRGQASLDYILVLAALLAFLAIWVPLISHIQERILVYSEVSEAKSAVSRLAHAAEEVYLLGGGNKREMRTEALNGMVLSVNDGKVAVERDSVVIEATGRFRAKEARIPLPSNGTHVIISCCGDDGKAEFIVSTGSR